MADLIAHPWMKGETATDEEFVQRYSCFFQDDKHETKVEGTLYGPN